MDFIFFLLSSWKHHQNTFAILSREYCHELFNWETYIQKGNVRDELSRQKIDECLAFYRLLGHVLVGVGLSTSLTAHLG